MNEKDELKLLDDIAEILAVQNEQKINAQNQMEKNRTITEELVSDFDSFLAMQETIIESVENNSVADSLISDIDAILKTESVFSKDELKQLDTVDVGDSWEKFADNNRCFAEEHGIDISNPYFSMFSNSELAYFNREMIEKFEICELDKMDYAFASACGLITGLIDVCLVGTIDMNASDSFLQSKVDGFYDKVVTNYARKEKIASLKEHQKAALKAHPENRNEINNKFKKLIDEAGDMDKKQSISFLEKNHNVAYDMAQFPKGSVESELFKGFNPSNHHLYSVAHNPGLVGLITGIIDQITETVTLIVPETGEVLHLPAVNKQKELGKNLPEKIINAIINWYGHVMSDIAGSKTSKGRGAGLPVPGWEALQKLHYGKFSINDKNLDFAELTTWMYTNGYDVRAFNAQLIPVLINETLVRVYWFIKQHFYFGKSVKESLPIANNRELSRMLLIATASFSAIDVVHASIKSKGGTDLGTLIMTINIPELIDLGFRCFQNIRNEFAHRKAVEKKIDEDIKEEWNRLLLT